MRGGTIATRSGAGSGGASEASSKRLREKNETKNDEIMNTRSDKKHKETHDEEELIPTNMKDVCKIVGAPQPQSNNTNPRKTGNRNISQSATTHNTANTTTQNKNTKTVTTSYNKNTPQSAPSSSAYVQSNKNKEKSPPNTTQRMQHSTGGNNTNTSPRAQTTQTTQNTTTDQHSQYMPTHLYTEHDRAPFFVILEKDDINEINVSRYLIKEGIDEIEEVRKLGRNRVRVKAANTTAANAVLTNDTIKSTHQINAFIPNQFVRTIGIVRGVPLDMTIAELAESYSSTVPIESLERLTYWDNINKIAKPGTSLKIVFRATYLPHEIYIFHAVKKVDFFIPRPVVCKNCMRFGHTAKMCKSKESVCNRCAETTHAFFDNTCDKQCEHCLGRCVEKCKHCTENNNHRTASKECPEMKKQTKIKEQMVVKRITYAEAKQLVENRATNEGVTYANVGSVMQLNNTLIERMKVTENLLREIGNIVHSRMDTDNEENDEDNTDANRDILDLVGKHFQRYRIQFQTPNPDGNGGEDTGGTPVN